MDHLTWLAGRPRRRKSGSTDGPLTLDELQLATRNKGMPVEALRYDITPVGMHIPPGFPDFLTRARTVDRGAIELAGRAWSGSAPIVRVEVGIDGIWQDARVSSAPGPFARHKWSLAWDARPGEHLLTCRATDGKGDVQPIDAPWNVQGMGNNAVQAVRVTVR